MSRHRSPSRRDSGGWRSSGYRSRRSSERSRDRSRDRERDYYDRRDRSRSRSRSSMEEDGNRLHVADLNPDTTKKGLESTFRKFGPLVEVWLARTPQSFAFIVFQRRDDAQDAIKAMHGKKLDGYRVRVTKARPRTRGQRHYRGYNPNLRCYECGKQGHFSRDCKKNELSRSKHSSKDRAIVIPVDDINSWEITDEDIVRYNLTPTSSRSSSRSRSSSSSRSGRRHHSRSRSQSRSQSRSRSRSRSRNRSKTKKKSKSKSRSRSNSRSKSRSKSRSRDRSRSRSRNSEDKESKGSEKSKEKKDENGNDSALERKEKTLVGLDYDSSSPPHSPEGSGKEPATPSTNQKPVIISGEPIAITMKTDNTQLNTSAMPSSPSHQASDRVVTVGSEARTVTLKQVESEPATGASNDNFA